MTLLEDDLRAALRAEAQALRVPERPELDREVVESGRYSGPRWLVAAACLALIVAGVVGVAQQRDGDPEPPPLVDSVVPATTVPAPTVTSVVPDTTATEGAETEILNGFLAARLAGEGAQEYLIGDEDDIPVLYSTTSGAPYERAEFERVTGIEWPNNVTAFKVRLFAGDTVVEQIFFTPGAGRLGLEYRPDSFGTDIAPTSEDGQPLAVPHDLFGGVVTAQVPYPWTSRGDGVLQLIPRDPGEGPTVEPPERAHWDELYLVANPTSVAEGCPTFLGGANAMALAESLLADPDLGATAPVAVSVGGVQALMMDVAIPAGTTICTPASDGIDLLRPVFDFRAPYSVFGPVGTGSSGVYTGRATGELMRLYLVDAPEGSFIKTLAIAFAAPASRFDKVVETAAPVIESIEFHTP